MTDTQWAIRAKFAPCDKCEGTGRVEVFKHFETWPCCKEDEEAAARGEVPCNCGGYMPSSGPCPNAAKPTNVEVCLACGGHKIQRPPISLIAYYKGEPKAEAETPGILRDLLIERRLLSDAQTALWLGEEIWRVWTNT